MTNHLAALLLSVLLASCGGGGGASIAPAPPEQVRVAVNGPAALEGSFNTSVAWGVRLPDDVAGAVAAQARQPGSVVLTMRPPYKDWTFPLLDEWLREAARYPNIRYVVPVDELFWAFDGAAEVRIGAHAAEITAAARRMQASGLRTVMPIDSEVLLDPGFSALEWDAFDVVLPVVYPSVYIRQAVPHDTHGCLLSPNRYKNIYDCSVRRLRELGFRGQVGPVFQAFGIRADATNTDPLTAALEASLAADLAEQQAAVAAISAEGADWLVPFGWYSDPNTVAPLYPGKGSPIEPLVRLPN